MRTRFSSLAVMIALAEGLLIGVVGTGAPNAAASNIGGPACTDGWVAAPSPSLLANQISDGQSRLRLYYANPDVDAAYFSSEFGIQWCYQVVGDGLTNGTVAYEFQDPATGLCLTFNKAAYSSSHPGSLDETGCFLTQVVPSERWDIAAGYWPAPYTSIVWIHNQWVEENTNINGSGLGGYADSCLAADANGYAFVGACSTSGGWGPHIDWSYN